MSHPPSNRDDRAAKESAVTVHSPAVAIPADGATNIMVTEKRGDFIGRYKLLQGIGEGSFGTVYMAEQQEPVQRRVALKIIKLGMDSKQFVARFEAERQALALMDHPHIAKVLDGGATDLGRPYFVMELVDGVPITQHCDMNHLTTRERLELFILICKAIQHAHQKGIIHRDIKPSNILVTLQDTGPVPKVIDFGIVKALDQPLTEKTLLTHVEQFMGTPAYMSPEQAGLSGQDIDTRSDIYSLGVLLYELLTGQTPFATEQLMSSGFEGIRRTLREQDPPRPSTRLATLSAADLTGIAHRRRIEPARLPTLIRGDLDWIVMKALEKDRTRRYDTANDLAMDIQRHLNCEPVVARPPSRLYEFQKTVRRHKFGFGAAAALIMVLAAGMLVSTSEAIRATRAEREQARLRQQAETEAAKSQQVAQFLKDMLNGVGPSVARGRDTVMLREILDKTAERVSQDLKEQPDVERELRDTIGEVYRELASYEQAETMERAALAKQRELFGNENRGVASRLFILSRTIQAQGRIAEAEAMRREALALLRKLLGNEHRDVAVVLSSLAALLQSNGKLDEAEAMAREVLAIQRKVLGHEHPGLAPSLTQLTAILFAEKKFTDAESFARECLAIHGTKAPDDWFTANARSMLGDCLLGQKQYATAEPLLLSGYDGMLQYEDKSIFDYKAAKQQAVERLVRLYEATGRSDKAADWKKKLAE